MEQQTADWKPGLVRPAYDAIVSAASVITAVGVILGVTVLTGALAIKYRDKNARHG